MLLALLALAFEASNAYKMIKIDGSVIGEPRGTSGDISTCLNDCLTSSNCFLVYSTLKGKCVSLTVSSAYQVNLTKDGRFVGFKVDSASCPKTYQNVDYTVTMPDSFTYQWTLKNKLWTFDGCRNGWTNSQRADGTSVCMKVFTVPKLSFDASREQCAKSKAKLTGLASVKESEWVYRQLKTKNRWDGFWIGGVRSCVDPCRNFKWIDGYTTGTDAIASASKYFQVSSVSYGENCLTVALTDTSAIIDDSNCEAGKRASLGFVCGYKVGA